MTWPIPNLTFVAQPGNSSVVLRERLGEGVEASVWSVGQNRVAKVYWRARLDAATRSRLRQKLSLLTTLGLASLGHPALSHVAWPQASILDDKGELAGFLMPSVKGVPLHLVVKDPSWTLEDRCEVARQLARIVVALHGRAVHVGDLSPNNVLVFRGPGGIEVTLIDADSLSLPGFPGHTATSRYMLPAVHRGEEAFVPGPAGDAYALGFVLFELLLGGVSPYAHKGGEDSEETNIKKQFFALAEDSTRVPSVPLDWHSRWRQMPVPAQRMFEAAFRRGHSARPSASDWAALVSSTSFPRCWVDVTQPGSAVRSQNAILAWLTKRKSA